MRSAREAVRTVLDLERHGGTLVQRDDFTLVVSDYDHLYSTATLLLTEQFPGLIVTTQACSASSCGFIILFSFPPQTPWYRRAETAQLVLAAVLCVAVLAWTISAHDPARQ